MIFIAANHTGLCEGVHHRPELCCVSVLCDFPQQITMMHFRVMCENTTYLIHNGETRIIGTYAVEGTWQLGFQSLN